MKLITALSRTLSEITEPVVTHYNLCVILFNLLQTKKYHGETIEIRSNTRLSFPYVKGLAVQLREWGIISVHDDFPAGRVFQILGKSHEPEDVACSIDPFAYISHLSAMAFHGLTNRLPKVIYLSTPPLKDWRISANKKMLKDCQGLLDKYLSNKLPKLERIKFDKIKKNRVIKYSSVHHGNFKHVEGRMLRVATIGRTFLDMLRQSDYCGGMDHVIETFEKFGKQYSKLIIEEIDRHGKAIEKGRAGYLLEEYCHIKDSRLDEWAKHVQRGGSRKLDPTKEYREVYSDRWCISLNAD